MEADDDQDEISNYYYQPSSLIGELIKHLKRMSAKPQVDHHLGETLDIFIVQLNESQEYLTNGIFNLSFAEAALFLQNSVEVYGKKVDVLWDSALKYQMQLCSYQQNEESINEIAKVQERMIRKSRKKKLTTKAADTTNTNVPASNYENDFERLLESIPNIYDEVEEPIAILDEIEVQKKKAEQEEAMKLQLLIAERVKLSVKFRLPCGCEVFDVHTNEYLCPYNKLCTEGILSSLDLNFNNIVRQDEDEAQCDSNIRSSCLNRVAVVNITRLSQDLVTAYLGNSISDTSFVSEAPSIHTVQKDHEQLNDTEDHGYTSGPSQLCNDTQLCSIRRSNDDSGIFCSQFTNNDIMEGEIQTYNNFEKNIIREEDENVEPQSSQKCELHCSRLFAPLFSSTPRKVAPVVRIERLSRKRLLQFGALKQPRKKIPRFRKIKTFCSSMNNFEKFYSRNYLPSSGEGVMFPWASDDDSSDNDHPPPMDDVEPEAEDIEHESNIEFCKGIINVIVDNLDSLELTNESPAEQAVSRSKVEHQVTSQSDQDNCNPPSIAEEIVRSVVPTTKENLHNWHTYILPIIKTAESRPSFNIHEYGTVLLDAIPEGELLPFKDLVAGYSAGEASRYFLASLQLANTYNIELVNTCPGELATGHLKMRLLSRERYHEHLDEYEAPSEHTIKEKLAHVRAIQKQRSKSQNHLSKSKNQSLLHPLVQIKIRKKQRTK